MFTGCLVFKWNYLCLKCISGQNRKCCFCLKLWCYMCPQYCTYFRASVLEIPLLGYSLILCWSMAPKEHFHGPVRSLPWKYSLWLTCIGSIFAIVLLGGSEQCCLRTLAQHNFRWQPRRGLGDGSALLRSVILWGQVTWHNCEQKLNILILPWVKSSTSAVPLKLLLQSACLIHVHFLLFLRCFFISSYE